MHRTGPKSSRQCYYVTPADSGGFGLAGLWEHWELEDQAIDSCTIITAAPTSNLESLHHRMPLMLTTDQLDEWLHADPESAAALLQPNEIEVEIRPVESPKTVHG